MFSVLLSGCGWDWIRYWSGRKGRFDIWRSFHGTTRRSHEDLAMRDTALYSVGSARTSQTGRGTVDMSEGNSRLDKQREHN
jgi:hypothetical protein